MIMVHYHQNMDEMGFALQVKRAALEFFGQGLFTLNLSSGSSFRGWVGLAQRCFK